VDKRIFANRHRQVMTVFVLAILSVSFVVVGCTHRPRNALSNSQTTSKKNDQVVQSDRSLFTLGNLKHSALQKSRAKVTANAVAKTPSDDLVQRTNRNEDLKLVEAKHSSSIKPGVILSPFIQKRSKTTDVANHHDRDQTKQRRIKEVEIDNQIVKTPSVESKRNPFVDRVRAKKQVSQRKLPVRKNVFVDKFNVEMKQLQAQMDEPLVESNTENHHPIRDEKDRRVRLDANRMKSEMNDSALTDARKEKDTDHVHLKWVSADRNNSLLQWDFETQTVTHNDKTRRIEFPVNSTKSEMNDTALAKVAEASNATRQLVRSESLLSRTQSSYANDGLKQMQTDIVTTATQDRNENRWKESIVEPSTIPSRFEWHTVAETESAENHFRAVDVEGPIIAAHRHASVVPSQILAEQQSVLSGISPETTVVQANANSSADLTNNSRGRVTLNVYAEQLTARPAADSFYPVTVGDRSIGETESGKNDEPFKALELAVSGSDVQSTHALTAEPNHESRSLGTVNWNIQPETTPNHRSVTIVIPLIIGFLLGVSCLIGIRIFRRLPQHSGG